MTMYQGDSPREQEYRDRRDRERLDQAASEAEEVHRQALTINAALRGAERSELDATATRHGLTRGELDDAVREQRERNRELVAEAEADEQERREQERMQAEREREVEEAEERAREAERYQDVRDSERAAELPDYDAPPEIEPDADPVRDLFASDRADVDRGDYDRDDGDRGDRGEPMLDDGDRMDDRAASDVQGAAIDAAWYRQGRRPAPRRTIDVEPIAIGARPGYWPRPRRR